MSPETSSNFRSPEVPWYVKDFDLQDVTYGFTEQEHPEEILKKEIGKSLFKRRRILLKKFRNLNTKRRKPKYLMMLKNIDS